jgi:hypothetical protein
MFSSVCAFLILGSTSEESKTIEYANYINSNFNISNQNGQVKRGTYSNLQMVKSEIRPKVYDVGTGKYVWVEENVEEEVMEELETTDNQETPVEENTETPIFFVNHL